MKLIFVVAASENNVIGVQNELPWHLPDDLKFFKKITLNKPVLMGKNTWLSLGKPLPNRLNIVLSKTMQDAPEGVLRFDHLQQSLEYLQSKNTPEACIIGGGYLFKEALPLTQTIYLTRVHTLIENGDVFFPELPDNWKKVWEEHHFKDERHIYDFSFQQWEREGE